MQALNVDWDWQVRIIRKTLTLSSHENVILNLLTKQEKNGTCWFSVELTFEWYEGAMVFCIPWSKEEKNGTLWFWVKVTLEWYEPTMVFRIFIFIFSFRTNDKKEYLHGNDFHQSYGNYFESAILIVTYYQICSRFFLNIYKAHWLIVENFNVMCQHKC